MNCTRSAWITRLDGKVTLDAKDFQDFTERWRSSTLNVPCYHGLQVTVLPQFRYPRLGHVHALGFSTYLLIFTVGRVVRNAATTSTFGRFLPCHNTHYLLSRPNRTIIHIRPEYGLKFVTLLIREFHVTVISAGPGSRKVLHF